MSRQQKPVNDCKQPTVDTSNQNTQVQHSMPNNADRTQVGLQNVKGRTV